jgi:hypothetical protein
MMLDSTHDPARAAEMSWILGWALGTAQRYDQARAVRPIRPGQLIG